jgi:hypothetical protein
MIRFCFTDAPAREVYLRDRVPTQAERERREELRARALLAAALVVLLVLAW